MIVAFVIIGLTVGSWIIENLKQSGMWLKHAAVNLL